MLSSEASSGTVDVLLFLPTELEIVAFLPLPGFKQTVLALLPGFENMSPAAHPSLVSIMQVPHLDLGGSYSITLSCHSHFGTLARV